MGEVAIKSNYLKNVNHERGKKLNDCSRLDRWIKVITLDNLTPYYRYQRRQNQILLVNLEWYLNTLLIV